MQDKQQRDATIAKAKAMAKRASDQAREAIVQAVTVLKTLIRDPIGGQSEALKNLGPSNALKAGIVLVFLFSSSCFLSGFSLVAGLQASAQQFGASILGSIGIYFRLLLVSVIPAASVFACYFIVMKLLSKQQKELSVCLYTTGVSTIPLTFLFFCIFLGLRVFGFDAMALAALFAIGVFCLSTTFLLINSSMQFVYELSPAKAVLITPTLVLLAGFVSALLLSAAT